MGNPKPSIQSSMKRIIRGGIFVERTPDYTEKRRNERGLSGKRYFFTKVDMSRSGHKRMSTIFSTSHLMFVREFKRVQDRDGEKKKERENRDSGGTLIFDVEEKNNIHE